MIKNAILCVDDDKFILDSLRNELDETFGEKFLIKTAENAQDALQLFKEMTEKGYKFTVVIADYIMPNMKGDEFLKNIHEMNDRTFKIMLTGQADIEGISNAVNNANLYRILSKPWDYEELVFTVKEANMNFLKNEYIERQYIAIKRNKELTKSLKEYNNKFQKMLDDSKNIFMTVLPSLIKINTSFEKNYFLSPTKLMINFSLKIADELFLSIDEHYSFVILILLFHKVMQEIPEKFRGVDPCELDPSLLKEYFNRYFEQIDKLSTIEPLNKFAILLSELWEHYDGTGLPHGKNGNNLSKLTQIIHLSFLYHNGVYKFPPNAKEIIDRDNEILQTPDQTAQRHAQTVNKIFKNSSWYDLEIYDVFNKLLKTKVFRDIIIDKNLIKVYFHGDDINIAKYASDEFHYDDAQKLVIPYEKLLQEIKSKEEDIKNRRSLETELSLQDIKAGMIVGAPILTKYGRLIVPENATLTLDDIEEIQNVRKHGLLNEQNVIKVFIPREF